MRALAQLKVARVVILAIAVLVVDALFPGQWPAQLFGHDQAVFSDVTSAVAHASERLIGPYPDKTVPLGIGQPAPRFQAPDFSLVVNTRLLKEAVYGAAPLDPKEPPDFSPTFPGLPHFFDFSQFYFWQIDSLGFVTNRDLVPPEYGCNTVAGSPHGGRDASRTLASLIKIENGFNLVFGKAFGH